MKRRTLIVAITVAVVLLVSTAVVASGGYLVPEPDPAASDPVRTGQGELDDPADDVERELPAPEPAVAHDVGSTGALTDHIVSIVGADAVPKETTEDAGVEWAFVLFETPTGDELSVSVQALTSNDRPGSHIGSDWTVGELGPYSAAYPPVEAIDRYQQAAARQELRMSDTAAESFVEDVALRLAEGLE
jgi:hypothetical protein